MMKVSQESWYVPIDYIGGEIVDMDFNRILNSTLLIFTENINTETGEVITKNKDGRTLSHRKSAEYRGMRFRYFPDSKKMFISGSLHKYMNGGKHNHNDFPYTKFAQVLQSLERKFGIRAKNIKLSQIEWGVNITPPTSIDRILKSTLLHKSIRFEKGDVGHNGNYHQCKHSDYIIKMYDKSRQYNTSSPILRIERKQVKYAHYLRKKSMGNTLQDLIDSRFDGLRDSLLHELEHIIFFDPELREGIHMRDPQYWEELREKTKRSNVQKMREKLKKLNREKGANYFEKIIDLVLKKIDEVNDQEFTDYQLSYSSNTLTTSSYCLETGIDISMQKQGSHFLNVVGLRQLRFKSPNEYKRIRSEYLSSRWYGDDVETQMREIAHNIRTRYRDSRRRDNKKFMESVFQYDLFSNRCNSIIYQHYGIN